MSVRVPPLVIESTTNTPEREAEVLKGVDDVHAFIISRAKDYIINHGDIKTWHRKLFAKVVPVDYYAGHYRMADQQSDYCEYEQNGFL
ncbi:MAG TPA: hypothetical protein VN223_06135 [Candidatus Elarobacter sp.]|nr:hypothetical protein [Candidatus Elarobacter sp.]